MIVLKFCEEEFFFIFFEEEGRKLGGKGKGSRGWELKEDNDVRVIFFLIC